MQSRFDRDDSYIVRAFVPLAELSGFDSHLLTMSYGRATHVIQFDRYQPVPPRWGAGEEDGPCVRAPVAPSPTRHQSGIALPEPDDGPVDTGDRER